MKKVLLISVLATLIFLTGCVNGRIDEEKAKIKDNFTADFSAKTATGTFKAKLTRYSGDTEIVFCEPMAIDGLTVKKNSSGYEIGFEGLDVKVSDGWFPEKSLLSAADSVFDIVTGEASRYTVKKFAGNLIYTGSVSMGDFELVRDVETACITTLSIPSESVEITFSDYVESTE